MVKLENIHQHIDNEIILALASVWGDLQQERGQPLPHQSQFNIEVVQDIIPYMTFFRMDGAGEIFFEFTGSFVDRFFRQSLSGFPLSKVASKEGIKKLTDFHHAMIEHKCGAYVKTLFVSDYEYELEYQTLTIPIDLHGGQKGSVACLVADGIHPSVIDGGEVFKTIQEIPQDTFWIDVGHGVPDYNIQAFKRYSE